MATSGCGATRQSHLSRATAPPIQSYKLTHNILTARIRATTLNFSEIRVVQDNQVPASRHLRRVQADRRPYCADVQVQLTATGTSQVHFELALEANAQTFVAQCCRSPV